MLLVMGMGVVKLWLRGSLVLSLIRRVVVVVVVLLLPVLRSDPRVLCLVNDSRIR